MYYKVLQIVLGYFPPVKLLDFRLYWQSSVLMTDTTTTQRTMQNRAEPQLSPCCVHFTTSVEQTSQPITLLTVKTALHQVTVNVVCLITHSQCPVFNNLCHSLLPVGCHRSSPGGCGLLPRRCVRSQPVCPPWLPGWRSVWCDSGPEEQVYNHWTTHSCTDTRVISLNR